MKLKQKIEDLTKQIEDLTKQFEDATTEIEVLHDVLEEEKKLSNFEKDLIIRMHIDELRLMLNLILWNLTEAKKTKDAASQDAYKNAKQIADKMIALMTNPKKEE